MADDKIKKCPEYCPFLQAHNTFCGLFHRTLQTVQGLAQKCEDCMNPEQRMSSYKALGLSVDGRAEMWQKAIFKHNEIELGKKREEEAVRKKFAEFLEDKFGSKPPLDGNAYLTSLVINLYMVLDATERSMMLSVLNGKNGLQLIEAVDGAAQFLRGLRQIDADFLPVKAEELPYLDINVDVLSEAEDIDSKEELDIKRYGVIVSSGNRLGLLLPDLEGIDTVDEQIRIAAQKGGIDLDEDYHLQRFEVIRHE